MRPPIDPPEAAELLRWASLNGFTTHIVGEVDAPTAMVLVRFVGDYIDLAHLRGADRTEAARIPCDELANVWRPKFVVWHYYCGVLESLLALRSLPHPGHESAPRERYEPPRDSRPEPLTVTDAERVKTTIRPPARQPTKGRPA